MKTNKQANTHTRTHTHTSTHINPKTNSAYTRPQPPHKAMNRNESLYRDTGGVGSDKKRLHHIAKNSPVSYQHDATPKHVLVPVEGVRPQPDKHDDVDEEHGDV